MIKYRNITKIMISNIIKIINNIINYIFFIK